MSTSDNKGKPAEAIFKIPFESLKYAEIAYNVLNVDKEPRRNFVQKTLRLEDDTLAVHFVADTVKNLRTAITSFFELLLLCQDTIKEFALTDDIAEINNARAHASTNTT